MRASWQHMWNTVQGIFEYYALDFACRATCDLWTRAKSCSAASITHELYSLGCACWALQKLYCYIPTFRLMYSTWYSFEWTTRSFASCQLWSWPDDPADHNSATSRSRRLIAPPKSHMKTCLFREPVSGYFPVGFIRGPLEIKLSHYLWHKFTHLHKWDILANAGTCSCSKLMIQLAFHPSWMDRD